MIDKGRNMFFITNIIVFMVLCSLYLIPSFMLFGIDIETIKLFFETYPRVEFALRFIPFLLLFFESIPILKTNALKALLFPIAAFTLNFYYYSLFSMIQSGSYNYVLMAFVLLVYALGVDYKNKHPVVIP